MQLNEQMEFPDTFEEFVKYYGFKDKEEVYTNGSELIQVFRVKQWLEHIQKPTQMLDKSNFSQEQYRADTDCAYDCGYNKGFKDGIRSSNIEHGMAEIAEHLVDYDVVHRIIDSPRTKEQMLTILEQTPTIENAKPIRKCENCRYYSISQTLPEPLENYHFCYQSTEFQKQHVKSDDWCDRFTSASWIKK